MCQDIAANLLLLALDEVNIGEHAIFLECLSELG